MGRITEKPLKIRLIQPNTHTPSKAQGGEKHEKCLVHKGKSAKPFWRFLSLFLRTISVPLLLPYFSYAAFPLISIPLISGSSSVDSESVSSSTSEYVEPIYTSQNIEVLSPVVDNNQVDGPVGGGEILVVDDSALVPEIGVSGTALDIDHTKNNGKISVYEVREGDTLSQIAEMFDVSVNTIRWANNFSGPIKPGQILVILPVTGLTHKVKNGGTIADIAKIYNADVREIALFNGIDENTELKPGDEIIVPNVDPVIKDSGTKNSTIVYKGPTGKNMPGYYTNPVPTAIKTQGLHGYNGIDMGAPTGTPVYAAAAGTVIDSRYGGWNGGYALMIIIAHDNGSQSLYAHLSENMVSVGQKVDKGEMIGRVGSTGNSTGPHLHFEVRGAANPLAACTVGTVCGAVE